MGEKVTRGAYGRVAAAECTMAVLKALSGLEGGYPLPQAGDSSASSSSRSSTGCVSITCWHTWRIVCWLRRWFAVSKIRQSYVSSVIPFNKMPELDSWHPDWYWQDDYHNEGDVSAARTLVLDFEEIPSILSRRIEWTKNELDDALQLLSDNMWKLQNFLDIVVRLD